MQSSAVTLHASGSCYCGGSKALSDLRPYVAGPLQNADREHTLQCLQGRCSVEECSRDTETLVRSAMVTSDNQHPLPHLITILANTVRTALARGGR